MKIQWILFLGLLVLVGQVQAEEKGALKNQKDKVSYIIGMDIGTNL
ncbi:MAG: hypothetical protein QME90_01760 [Thermodesulfobacteriota bacterium]|nr:hypothetical protein [Thermodesulfobacteriota bacterium]